MKKLALILVALLVAGFAFAELEATIDGDATLTWGIDLETNETGFTNASSSSISLTLVSGSEMMDGDALYGYISLADFEIGFDETDGTTITAPSVTARLILSPEAYLYVYSAPGDATGSSANFAHLDGTGEDDIVAVDLGTTGGTGINYDFGLGTFDLGIFSFGDWDAGNANNDYGVSAFVALAPSDMIGVDLGFVYGPFSGATYGLEAAVSIAPADMLSVDVAFDLNDASDFEVDAAIATDLGVATFDVVAYFNSADLAEVQTVLGVSAVENLSLTNTFELYDLMGTLAWAEELALTYTIDTLMPYLTLSLDSANVIGINAGVEVALAPNTTFDINYATADVETDTGDVELSLNIAY